MDALQGYSNASLFVLSCPGPWRRHPASVTAVRTEAVTQVLLGYEAQLLAFAAAAPAIARRAVFTPSPEFFDTEASYAALWAGAGQPARPLRRLVHLRFGGSRSVRVMKGVRNAAVIAEDHRAPPIATGAHPFASGLLLPATVGHVLTYAAGQARPRPLAGEEAGHGVLPGICIGADLASTALDPGDASGFELVAMSEFRSASWAAGPLGLAPPALDGRAVLLPWNVEHVGSAIPELLLRLLRLSPGGRFPNPVIVMPFNYPGQTGIIRRLVAQLRNAAGLVGADLASLYFGRLLAYGALPALRHMAPLAWVDGNDPEHRWTLRRLVAAGFECVLLDATPHAVLPRPLASRIHRMPADDVLRIEQETRWGRFVVRTRVPAISFLPALLAETRARLGTGT